MGGSGDKILRPKCELSLYGGGGNHETIYHCSGKDVFKAYLTYRKDQVHVQVSGTTSRKRNRALLAPQQFPSQSSSPWLKAESSF